jgi:DNA-damage-inducible protein D
MSGVYDVKNFMDALYDDNFYFNNPVDYIPNLSDPWLLGQLAGRPALRDRVDHLERENLELRQQASEGFKALSGAAREAGVQDKMFGVFHDAGYKGLYGGLGVDAIKDRKGIDPKEQLMDRMGTTELAANQFRMTQTREKLKRERIQNQRDAIQTHEEVGREVRAAIAKIGGTPLENIPPAEHIKNVKKRLKNAKPVLTLKAKDSLGLVNSEK